MILTIVRIDQLIMVPQLCFSGQEVPSSRWGKLTFLGIMNGGYTIGPENRMNSNNKKKSFVFVLYKLLG